MKVFAATLVAAELFVSRNTAVEAFGVVVSYGSTAARGGGGQSSCRNAFSTTRSSRQQPIRPFKLALLVLAADSELSEEGVSDYKLSDDDDVLLVDEFDLDSSTSQHDTGPDLPLDGMERAWRHSKKPLLRIGAKGATLSHGNSLRQLLQAHTAVKVKVSTQRFDGDLHVAFERLRALAEESGAPAGIECLQAREKDSVILFGMPGTGQRIASGEFPVSAPTLLEP